MTPTEYIGTVRVMAADGLSCFSIAQKLGKSYGAIYKFCRRNKIELRTGFYLREKTKSTHENGVRIAALRKRRGGAAAHNRIWNNANREKYLAHKAVENAVRKGILARQPCQVCGDGHLVHAHHDDYSLPLEVIWLCPLHHKQRHKQLNAVRMSGSNDIRLP